MKRPAQPDLLTPLQRAKPAATNHEPYFDIACRRIEQAYRQRDLFIEPPARVEPKAADLFAEPIPTRNP